MNGSNNLTEQARQSGSRLPRLFLYPGSEIDFSKATIKATAETLFQDLKDEIKCGDWNYLIEDL